MQSRWWYGKCESPCVMHRSAVGEGEAKASTHQWNAYLSHVEILNYQSHSRQEGLMCISSRSDHAWGTCTMRNMCSQNVRHFPHVHFIVHYFKVPSLAFIVPSHIVHIALHTKNNSNNNKKKWFDQVAQGKSALRWNILGENICNLPNSQMSHDIRWQ